MATEPGDSSPLPEQRGNDGLLVILAEAPT